ncbi:MAG: ribonuclease HII [Pseudomonadota bacterium]
MVGPDFAYEQAAYDRGATRVAGVDEVGRGPLAGPVTAAAVWLDPQDVPQDLNDSKRLSAAKRMALAEQLHQVADVSVGHASVDEIDRLNILNAAMLAMERAVTGLAIRADFLLIDGNRLPRQIDVPARAIVRGDAASASIAAASIVAKVARDRIMVDLAQQHPGYGWERNVGYPTKEHQRALLNMGATPHHRRSFKPVHNILYQGNN